MRRQAPEQDDKEIKESPGGAYLRNKQSGLSANVICCDVNRRATRCSVTQLIEPVNGFNQNSRIVYLVFQI
jgi:hypothetical protein